MALTMPNLSTDRTCKNEESGILLKTSDSDTNTDNQESRGQSLDEIIKKTLNKTTRTREIREAMRHSEWKLVVGGLARQRRSCEWPYLNESQLLNISKNIWHIAMRTGRGNRKRGGSGALYVSKRRELSFVHRQLRHTYQPTWIR